jgi:ribosome maturation factor RimP
VLTRVNATKERKALSLKIFIRSAMQRKRLKKCKRFHRNFL